MPYIAKDRRDIYDPSIEKIVKELLQSPEAPNSSLGELNYVIFKIVKRYVVSLGLRYHHLQNLVGTLECCKMEIYRKIIGPYEDKAIDKNGDIS